MTKSYKTKAGRAIRPCVAEVKDNAATTKQNSSLSALQMESAMTPDAVLDVHLVKEPDVRELIKEADVIMAFNTRTGEILPFWGRRYLQAIVNDSITRDAKTVCFGLDFESTDVEYLIAACCVLKGVPVDEYDTELLSFKRKTA